MRFFLVFVIVTFVFLNGSSLRAVDPAKAEEYKKRFNRGRELLEKEGKPEEALATFESIIKEEPTARGSLLFSGLIANRLGQNEKAEKYLTQFNSLEPKDHKGLILLIQATQSLQKMGRVEELREKLYELHDKTFTPGLSELLAYTRERIKGEKGTSIIINEYFDHKQEPYFGWEVIQVQEDPKSLGSLFNLQEGSVLRRVVFSYDPAATEKARKENPKSPKLEVFFLSEYILKDGVPIQINIYRQEQMKPDYSVFRKWGTEAILHPPKPIHVEVLK